MKILKGNSAERLREEFPELRKKYWGMHIWARGYFVSAVGIVDRDIIKQYVKNQQNSEIRHEQQWIGRDSGE
jgi:putative transposase